MQELTDPEEIEKLHRKLTPKERKILHEARLHWNCYGSIPNMIDLEQYTQEYQKNLSEAKTYRFRGDRYDVTRLFDFDILRESTPIDQLNLRCLNDRNNLDNLIRKHEKNLIFTSEGLIKTYPSDKFISFSQKYLQKKVDDDLKDLKFKDVISNSSEEDKITGYTQFENQISGVSPAITFLFPSKSYEQAKIIAKGLASDAQIYGYSLTSVDIFAHDKMIDVIIVQIQFEAKYAKVPFKFADTLIHISPLRYLQKIKRNGLVPTSKSFEYKYDGRVYLFNKCSKKMQLDYGKFKMNQICDVGFCIFKIKTSDLLNSQRYQSGKMKFYVDSSFSFNDEFNVEAIFTYDNIDKSLLGDTYLKVTEVGSDFKFQVERF